MKVKIVLICLWVAIITAIGILNAWDKYQYREIHTRLQKIVDNNIEILAHCKEDRQKAKIMEEMLNCRIKKMY